MGELGWGVFVESYLVRASVPGRMLFLGLEGEGMKGGGDLKIFFEDELSWKMVFDGDVMNSL